MKTKYLYFIFISLGIFSKSMNIFAQSVSINTSGGIPDSSAMLDIISADKGLLIPRVSLISITDSTTITHPAISLQVYNTNDSMTGGGKGFWYWNGTQWQRISSDGIENVWGTTGNAGTLAGTNFIGTTDNADWLIKTNNTERMRVLSSGNVGIGTTSPGSKLDVAGTANVSTSTTTPLLYGSSAANGDITIQGTSSGTKTSAYTIINPTGGATLFGTTSPIVANFFGSSNTPAISVVGASAHGSTIAMKAYATGATSGPYLVFGRSKSATVGIQTSTVSNDVLGAIGFEGVNTNATPASNYAAYIVGFQDDTGGTTTIPGRLSFFTGTNTALPTERMTIKSNGNVGIGTTAPVSKLDIEGGVSIGTSFSGTTVAPTNGVIIEGSVGIGLNTPPVKLSVYSGNTESIRLVGDGASGSTQGLSSLGFQQFAMVNPAAKIEFREAGTATYTGEVGIFTRGTNADVTPTERLTILASGNVGIGTSTPSTKLEVYSTTAGGANILSTNNLSTGYGSMGTIANTTAEGGMRTYGSGVSSNVFGNSIGNSTLVYGTGAANTMLQVGTLSSAPLILGTNNVERIRVLAGGNVGIGITSPTSMLTVAGSVAKPYTLLSAATTLNNTHYNVNLTNGSGSSYAITLPDPSTCPNRIYRIKQMTGTPCTVTTTAGTTIFLEADNTTITTKTLAVGTMAGYYMEFQSNGTQWVISY